MRLLAWLKLSFAQAHRRSMLLLGNTIVLRYLLAAGLLFATSSCTETPERSASQQKAPLHSTSLPPCTQENVRQLLIHLELRNGPNMRSSSAWSSYVGTSTQALCALNSAHPGIQASLPGTISADALGNQLVTLELPPLNEYQQLSATLSFSLQPAGNFISGTTSERLHEGKTDIWSKLPSKLERILLPLRTRPPHEQAATIFEWIHQNMTPDHYVTLPQPPEISVARGRGDCTDLSLLAVAMFRFLGMEAHVLNGYVCTFDCRDMRPHSWVVYRLDKAWSEVDLTLTNLEVSAWSRIPLVRWDLQRGGLKEAPLHRLDPPLEEGILQVRAQLLGAAE